MQRLLVLLTVCGWALIVAGIGLWSVPSALVVAGVGMVAAGLLVDVGGD